MNSAVVRRRRGGERGRDARRRGRVVVSAECGGGEGKRDVEGVKAGARGARLDGNNMARVQEKNWKN